MSSSRTILGVLVTTGTLAMGGSALMGYSLDPPNYSQGATVLNEVPPSGKSEAFFANDHDTDRFNQDKSLNSYVAPQESPAMGSDQTDQPMWKKSLIGDERERPGNH